jgi:hypothetical protein
MKQTTITFLLCAISAFGQTTAPVQPAQPAPTTSVNFPAIPMPTGVAAFGEFNQLGSPRFTMGISAIYPVSGSAGIYGTTTADILPKLVVDPTTGRKFFLLGADVGPSFNQAQPSGINVNFSSSFVATAVYQITPVFSFMLPVRMLYITGIGWNPIVEAGVIVNLKNLPKAKK